MKPKKFSEKVIQAIQSIPSGKVATYGLIAKLAGKPHGARGVSWILHSSSKIHKLPWHRVISSTGKIAFDEWSESYVRQARLLQKEGILIENGRIDLKTYLWK